MIAKLLLTSQENQTRQEMVLNKPRVTIGRKAGNDLHFNRPEISGTHAEFTFDSGRHFVTDLGSTNGTLLNGAQLLANQRYALQPNDVVTIAPFRITYVLEEESMETIIEVPAPKENLPKTSTGTVQEPVYKIRTGTEEHEKQRRASQEKKQAVNEAPKEPVVPPPPPPPAVEPPPEPAKPAESAPAPAPSAQEQISAPEPIPIRKQSRFMEYVWIGLGLLIFAAAIGLIVFLALAT